MACFQSCVHHRAKQSDETPPPALKSETASPAPEQPRPSDQSAENRTFKAKFLVALDVGHTPQAPGAIGADGTKEYDFNKRIVSLLAADLEKEPKLSVLIINKDGHEISLSRRSAIANAAEAHLFLAVHHDSANDRYLEQVERNGKIYRQTKRFHGYSVFFSRKNPHADESFKFAMALGNAMHAAGFTATLHHAEKIEGENRELVDSELGVYRFDDLVVLKRSNMPAALLECGVIVNPDEERELNQPDRQMKTVRAIGTAILQMAARDKLEKPPRDGATEGQ